MLLHVKTYYDSSKYTEKNLYSVIADCVFQIYIHSINFLVM